MSATVPPGDRPRSGPVGAKPFRVTAAGPAHSEGTRVIYNKAIETSTATFEMTPRTADEQLAWVNEHSGAHPAIVAVTLDGPAHGPEAGSGLEEQERVIGFGSLSPYRPRAAYSTTVENSVYVHDDFQRQGVGRALLEELLALAGAHGFHAVIARIAGGNEGSVALHRSCGFEVIGTEREVGRKFGRWLDVVCMQKLL